MAVIMMTPYGYCHCNCGQKTRLAPRNFAQKGWVKGEPAKFIRGHNGVKPASGVPNPSGYCKCGCGQKTAISRWSSKPRGDVRGQFRQYVRGHQGTGKVDLGRRPPARFEVVDGAPCVWVPLTKGEWALIDEADYSLVKDFLWYYAPGRATQGYAIRYMAESPDERELMHRRIFPVADGFDTDHINGNKLDNRRSNLRQATRAQNMYNKPVQKNNRCGVKGVTQTKHGTYQAQLMANGKSIYLGTFRTLEAARAARIAGEIKYHGEYRRVA